MVDFSLIDSCRPLCIVTNYVKLRAPPYVFELAIRDLALASRLQQFLGHSDIRITQKYVLSYSRV